MKKLMVIALFLVLASGQAFAGNTLSERFLVGKKPHFVVGIDRLGFGVEYRDASKGSPSWSLGYNWGDGAIFRYYFNPLRLGGKPSKMIPFAGGLTFNVTSPGAIGGITYDLADSKGQGWSINAELLIHPSYDMVPAPAIGVNFTF